MFMISSVSVERAGSVELVPGHQETLQASDEKRKKKRKDDGPPHAGEPLGNDVKAARLEDGMPEPVGRRHELAEDRADQRKTNGQFQAREDIAQRRGDHELGKDLSLGGAKG